MPIVSGTITRSGTVAYVSQEAWIFSGPLRENVLFGMDMDVGRYEEAIGTCALVQVWSVQLATYVECEHWKIPFTWNVCMRKRLGDNVKIINR